MLTKHYSTVLRIRLIILFKLKYCISLTKFVNFVNFFFIARMNFLKVLKFSLILDSLFSRLFYCRKYAVTEKERALIIWT